MAYYNILSNLTPTDIASYSIYVKIFFHLIGKHIKVSMIPPGTDLWCPRDTPLMLALTNTAPDATQQPPSPILPKQGGRPREGSLVRHQRSPCRVGLYCLSTNPLHSFCCCISWPMTATCWSVSQNAAHALSAYKNVFALKPVTKYIKSKLPDFVDTVWYVLKTVFRTVFSTSLFQQLADALWARLGSRHIQCSRVHVVHQRARSVKTIVHSGGYHPGGTCFHPAATV